MLSGLKLFVTDYPMAKAYFVYTGSRRMYEDRIEMIPILEALKNLRSFL